MASLQNCALENEQQRSNVCVYSCTPLFGKRTEGRPAGTTTTMCVFCVHRQPSVRRRQWLISWVVPRLVATQSSLTYYTRTLEHIQGLQSPPSSAVGPGRPARQPGTTVSTTNRRPDLGRGPLMRAGVAREHRVEGSRSSARLRHVQPDLRGQDHVRARLRTPILESARAHSSYTAAVL